MKKWKKIALIVGGVVLLLAIVGFSVQQSRKGVVQVQTGKVARQDLASAVTASGEIKPKTYVNIGANAYGKITKLYVKEGERVKAGQLLATIDNIQPEADVQANAASLDVAKTDYTASEAALKAAQTNIDKAKADLEHCTITSPIDGVVISRSVDVGQTVAASLQAPVIFQIANDLTKMQIDSNVAEADVGVVQVGQDVDFTVDAFPTQTFHGKVVQVRNAPITVQNVVTYDTVIGVSNPDLKLKPGMTANVAIETNRKDQVLMFPAAALRFKPEKASERKKPQSTAKRGKGAPPGEKVFIVGADGKPKPVQVTTGIANDSFIELLSGNLKENDQVIIGMAGNGAIVLVPSCQNLPAGDYAGQVFVQAASGGALVRRRGRRRRLRRGGRSFLLKADRRSQARDHQHAHQRSQRRAPLGAPGRPRLEQPAYARHQVAAARRKHQRVGYRRLVAQTRAQHHQGIRSQGHRARAALALGLVELPFVDGLFHAQDFRFKVHVAPAQRQQLSNAKPSRCQ